MYQQKLVWSEGSLMYQQKLVWSEGPLSVYEWSKLDLGATFKDYKFQLR